MDICPTTEHHAAEYDIFLSYRRDGGEAMAILLRDRLVAKGYSVFLDIENLNSGTFNNKLLDVIDGCKDFLLICSKGALDRCINEDDWVRLEISHALSRSKNIVPVMLREFSFPDNLPADIESVRIYNGINANSHEYFDAAVDRLTDKFLTSEPNLTLAAIEMPDSAVQKNKKALPLIICAALLIAAAVTIFLIFSNTSVTEREYSFQVGDYIYSGLYAGEWHNNMPNGQGSFTNSDINKQSTFEGEWQNGNFNGLGKYTLYNSDGTISFAHEGEFIDGRLNGQGKMTTYVNYGEFWIIDDAPIVKGVFEGNFVDGELQGQGKGTLYLSDETARSMQGEFRGTMLNGLGKITFHNKDDTVFAAFEGEFTDGILQGSGKAILYNSDGGVQLVQEGTFINSELKKGKITLYDSGGIIFSVSDGEFADSRLEGQGKYTAYNEDGTVSFVQEGEFSDGELQGQGTSVYYYIGGTIGVFEEGEFSGDELQGQGQVTWYHEDGTIDFIQEGEFVNGELNGQGKFTIYNEDGAIAWVDEGEFINGEFIG